MEAIRIATYISQTLKSESFIHGYARIHKLGVAPTGQLVWYFHTVLMLPQQMITETQLLELYRNDMKIVYGSLLSKHQIL